MRIILSTNSNKYVDIAFIVTFYGIILRLFIFIVDIQKIFYIHIGITEYPQRQENVYIITLLLYMLQL